MAKFLRIKEWETYQHYKDRSPSWIKLHKRLLDDYDFHRLPVASRALAPMLWLLASESKDIKTGLIDMDFAKIGFRLRMDSVSVREALNPLILGGFVIVSDDGVDVLAEPEQAASPEKRREETYTPEKEGTEIPNYLLDQYQITPKLLEDISLPHTQQNYRAGVAGVVLAKKEIKGTAYDAYKYIVEQAAICRAEGITIDCFWLNDGKFLPQNRTDKKYKNANVPQVSASELTRKMLEQG